MLNLPMRAAEKEPRKRTRTRWPLSAKLRVLELWFSGMRARQVFKSLSSEGATRLSQAGVNSPHSHIRQFIDDIRNELRGSRRDIVIATLETKVLPVILRKCGLKSDRTTFPPMRRKPLELPEIEVQSRRTNNRYVAALNLLAGAGIVQRAPQWPADASSGAPKARLSCPVCGGDFMIQTREIIFQYSYFKWNPRHARYQRGNRTRGCPRPFTTQLDCECCKLHLTVDHREWEKHRDECKYGQSLNEEQQKAVNEFIQWLGRHFPVGKLTACSQDQQAPVSRSHGFAPSAHGVTT